MKKLSHLVVFLLLIYLNSKAQTNVLNDSRIAPLLKQAAAGQPELIIFGRDNTSRYVNMAVLDKSRKMLTWFTCYGNAFDSAQLTDVEYNYIASKAVTSFDFYKQFCFENIGYLEDAESHFRQFGKEALKDTTYNRQLVYSSPAVKLAPSTLQKVLAMESLLKKKCLQLALFNSESPSHARRNDTFLLRKSLAGKMVRKGDTTTYYNTYLLGAAAKIALCKRAPDKLFVYNRLEQVIDSVPLKPEKYASLLKEKEDVFLLYRGWLELQSQQVLDARRQVSGLLSVEDTSLFTQTKLQEDHQKALWHSMLELEQRQLAIEQKISSLLIPDPQTVKNMLQDAYPDAPSEVSYLEGLGFAYTTSYTRGQKVYELTDHRGNVMATVSDKKKAIDDNQDGVIEYYNADVVNANDYYPFGMLEPDRIYNTENSYRYGYNGKEKDGEIKGEGNQIDYGMRTYDPRIGRFLSVDPLTQQYPWYTPYQYAGNKPIKFIDRDGEEESDPDKYYKKSIPIIKTTFANNVDHLPADERTSTLDAISTAFNRVHLFTFYGRYLSARLMTRWMEGKGGYDILSYKALSNAGGSWSFNHTINSVEKDVKNKLFAYASSLNKPGSYDISVSSYDNHLQGGAVLSDIGTALGSYNVYATGKFTINIDKKRQERNIRRYLLYFGGQIPMETWQRN